MWHVAVFTTCHGVLLEVVVCDDRVKQVEFAVFVGGKMLAGRAGHIDRTGFVCARTAVLCCVRAAVLGYIFIG